MSKNQYGDTNIPDIDFAVLAQDYMCKYGANINLQRAIPMIIDGLKPVQRRLLYMMYEHYKTAKHVRVTVVMGELMKIHPHGDQGLGDTIARLCQDFTNIIPLVGTTSNAGNITGGNDAAAPRYLDIFLPEFTKEVLFKEFDNTVNMIDSYDGTYKEPFSLPARFPIILLNGSAGIGYTLSSDIPPYCLNEVADATIKLLQNPNAKIRLIPDSPTGCDIIVTGDHSFVMQSTYVIDPINYTITITSTPYQCYLNAIDKALRELQLSATPIKEILSADNECELSEGIFKYTIRCSKCNLYNVIDTLFKRVPGFRSGISTSNMEVVDTDFRTKKYDCRQILLSWINARITIKRAWYLRMIVNQQRKRNILEGKLFMLSPENIDTTVATIRKSDKSTAVENLRKAFNNKVSSVQANEVASMPFLDINIKHYKKTIEDIKQLDEELAINMEIVKDPQKIRDVIISEIKDIKEKYGKPRCSRIIDPNKTSSTNIGLVQILTDGSFMLTETDNFDNLASDVTPISGNEVCLIDDKGVFLKVDIRKVLHNQPMTLTSIGKTTMGKCVAAVACQTNNIIMLSNKGRIKYMPISKIPSNATRKPLVPLDDDEFIVSILEVDDSNTTDVLIYTETGDGKRIQTSQLNKVSSLDSVGQIVVKDGKCAGMFCLNPNKPFLVYVTRLGRLRLNHSKFLTTGKKFSDTKNIITMSPNDDLVAVFCVDKNQTVILNHADGRTSSVHVDSLPISTMSLPAERPKHVAGVKVIRATIS